MPKFTNVSGQDRHVYAREGHAGALFVRAGQVVDVPGNAQDIGDAYLVDGRLWPKSTWDLARSTKKSSTSGKADDVAEPDPTERK